MHPKRILFLLVGGLYLASFIGGAARAEFTGGSDGSDGALDCVWLGAHATCDHNPCACSQGESCTCTLDLGLAKDGHWRDSPGGGSGIYDANQWAVVFKLATLEIPANVTIKFKNHPSGAPVVFLVQGDVDVYGTVNLDGQDAIAVAAMPSFSEPGPGGFPGGAQWNPTALVGSLGFGPGSAQQFTNSPVTGCFSGRVTNGSTTCPLGQAYGNEESFPLIGGSGGGTRGNTFVSWVGGAGGGAILIASASEIHLAPGSAISVLGGVGINWSPCCAGQFSYAGHGTAGAIRLLAGAKVSGPGALRIDGREAATGGGSQPGGRGRLRIEAPTIDVSLPTVEESAGVSLSFTPGEVFPGADAPILEILSVDGSNAPADPQAGPRTTDVEIDTDEGALIVIRAWNIPAATTVKVRVVPIHGGEVIIESTPLQEQSDQSLRASAVVPFPPGRSEIQLRANWTP